MAKTKTVRVSDEELELLQKLREGQVDVGRVVEAAPEASETPQEAVSGSDQSAATRQLAAALTEALKAAKGPEKKNVFTRSIGRPWWPKDGKRLKMNRVFLQHGIPIERVSNEVIELLNQIRPGWYCEGHVKVTLRKDRAMDITYPVKTAAQRLKLVNQFGIRSFKELLERIVDEHKNPTRYRRSSDLDMFDENPTN